MKRFDLSFHFFLSLMLYQTRAESFSKCLIAIFTYSKHLTQCKSVMSMLQLSTNTYQYKTYTAFNKNPMHAYNFVYTLLYFKSIYICVLAVLDRWIFVSLTCLIHLVFSVRVTESFRIELSLELFRHLSRFQIIYYLYVSICYILDDKSSILKPPNESQSK